MPSTSGNKYVFLLYDYDSNYILLRAIPSRTKIQLKRAYEECVVLLKSKGFTPKLHRLDNETSKIMTEYMDKEGITYQLTPAGSHRRNIAEKAIQTFKNHFVSILCGVDEKSPMSLWDKLMPQAEMTLNLLRQSRLVPNVSAYAHMHGIHDYNGHPLAPMGCAVKMHVMPSVRDTWESHTVSGYYLGVYKEHYRCHKV